MSLLDARFARPLEGGASFSLRNRLARAVWAITWLVLARWTPPPLHAWRRLVMIAFGAKMGPGARVYSSTRVWLPANLDLAANTLIGPGVNLYNQGRIIIGRGSVISQGAHICASSHDIRDPNFQLVLRPVTVGEDCWVAADAFVGPGVIMADGCVLAARGALFDDGAAWTVYRGNPAAPVKKRELRTD